MRHHHDNLAKLIGCVDRATPHEGVNRMAVGPLGTFRMTSDLARAPEMETPAIVILLQGTKVCYVGGEESVYHGPRVLVGLYPTPVETQIIGASEEQPFLAVGIDLDLGRLMSLLIRIDEYDEPVAQPPSVEATAKFSLDLTDDLIDAFLRLFAMLEQPRDVAILGDGVIDEIYYRLLSGERGADLRALLQRNGRIKRISRAVDYIHGHLDEPVSVDRLADTVHMSRTAFFENFKEVMQLSPLQYAKSIKLLEARRLILEGRRVNETSRMVGYNNIAQFSRENGVDSALPVSIAASIKQAVAASHGGDDLSAVFEVLRKNVRGGETD